jgi:hypothetical protein
MSVKKGLIIFAWISIVGSVGDGLIGLYGLIVLISDPSVTVAITVEELIKNYISFLYWVKSIAYYVLPENVVAWIFAIPAFIYFPMRVISSVVVGYYVLKLADRM